MFGNTDRSHHCLYDTTGSSSELPVAVVEAHTAALRIQNTGHGDHVAVGDRRFGGPLFVHKGDALPSDLTNKASHSVQYDSVGIN